MMSQLEAKWYFRKKGVTIRLRRPYLNNLLIPVLIILPQLRLINTWKVQQSIHSPDTRIGVKLRQRMAEITKCESSLETVVNKQKMRCKRECENFYQDSIAL